MTVLSTKPTTAWAEVDDQGRLILPPEVARQYGLNPGSKVRLDEGHNFVRMHRPVTHLTKVYIEPTVACNLDCITCFRNAWDQPIGRMTEETFERIFAGLKELDPVPSVYFGGIGEPLFHVKTIEWIRRIKRELDVKVELITNGTILTEKKSRELIDAGLDVLWVSLDGATPEGFADVRLGAELPNIVASLERFVKMRAPGHYPTPELGIAFVAMKRNIADLLGHVERAAERGRLAHDLLPEALLATLPGRRGLVDFRQTGFLKITDQRRHLPAGMHLPVRQQRHKIKGRTAAKARAAPQRFQPCLLQEDVKQVVFQAHHWIMDCCCQILAQKSPIVLRPGQLQVLPLPE